MSPDLLALALIAAAGLTAIARQLLERRRHRHRVVMDVAGGFGSNLYDLTARPEIHPEDFIG
jgi:hypothetical protein